LFEKFTFILERSPLATADYGNLLGLPEFSSDFAQKFALGRSQSK
jgi:hypothetical protein